MPDTPADYLNEFKGNSGTFVRRDQSHLWSSIAGTTVNAIKKATPHTAPLTGFVCSTRCRKGTYIPATCTNNAATVPNSRMGLRNGDETNEDLVSERQFPT